MFDWFLSSQLHKERMARIDLQKERVRRGALESGVWYERKTYAPSRKERLWQALLALSSEYAEIGCKEHREAAERLVAAWELAQ